MRSRFTIQLVIAAVALLVPLGAVLAGNILPSNSIARFYDTGSRIHMGLAQGNVTVTDTGITGHAWAEDWGWINFSPTGYGVQNDGAGNLSGYAWGENLGWINFNPTHGGVTIDSDGYFSGYAWAENGGWIEFCLLPGPTACVRTTWTEDPEDDEDDTNPPGQFIPQPPVDEPEDEIPDVDPPTEPPVDPEGPPTTPETPDPEEPSEPDEEPEDPEDDEGGTTPPGDGGDDEVPPGDDDGPFEDIITTITEIINNLLEIPGRTVTLVTALGTLLGAAPIGAMFLMPLHFGDLVFLPARLWTLILAALGFRKRREPWGTVYDSVTKQPLDPAYVQLINEATGKEEEGILTDLDGRFGFLPNVGRYKLSARKTNYAFPSKRLMGNTADALYDNLYFGEDVAINSENDAVIRNIPLDPVGVDWNEVQKRKGNMFSFYSKYDVIFYTFTSILFYLGFAVAIFAAIFLPSLIHTIILVLYGVLVLLRSVTGSPKNLGSVYDANGDPLAYAAVRVFIANTENQVKQVVTNQNGKFYCLVTPANYYVKVFKRVGEEEYEEVYTSDNFYTKNGLVDLRFNI